MWMRTELENYLLDPDTIARVSGAATETVAINLAEIYARLREDTRTSFTSTWVSAAQEGKSIDILLEAEQLFDNLWAVSARREEIVRGTDVIKELNTWLERDGYRAISGHALAKAIRPQFLAPEILNVILGIEDMIL